MKSDFVIALLSFGCLCEAVCVLGVVWFRDAFDQLHFCGAASTVGLFSFVAAVAVQGFATASGTIDCIVALFLTFALGPVMISATARAGRRMEFDSLEPRPNEYEQQP